MFLREIALIAPLSLFLPFLLRPADDWPELEAQGGGDPQELQQRRVVFPMLDHAQIAVGNPRLLCQLAVGQAFTLAALL